MTVVASRGCLALGASLGVMPAHNRARGFPNLALPPALDIERAVECSVRRLELDLAGDRPDEADHLARDRRGDHDLGLAGGDQTPITAAEPQLRLPGEVANGGGQLLDAVVQHEPGRKLVAAKNVTVNEEFFQGHFPGTPLMPGVLMIEALAQVAAVLLFERESAAPNAYAYLRGVENAKFRRQVVPGDRLTLAVTLGAERPRDRYENGEYRRGGQPAEAAIG